MQKRFYFTLFFILFNSFIFLRPPSALAKTADEYLSEALNYYEKAEYDKVISILEEAAKLYPSETKIHYGLVDSYNELGQKHYFTNELCLRIIYHNEKFLELEPNPPQKDEIMEFLRKTIGHYDVAGIAKVMEAGGDGAEFQLPPDNISLDEKLQYKDKAVQRLQDYDIAKKESLYKAEVSGKTIEEIIALLDNYSKKIQSVHFKKINTYGGKADLLEEVFYKQPDKFKAIQPTTISINKNNKYYVIDKETNKIVNEQDMNLSEQSILTSLCMLNFVSMLRDYDLKVEKVQGAPKFLTSIYENNLSPNIYLITGMSRDKNAMAPKVEFFIDINLGLTVDMRQYLIGILGSGKEYELARETIVTNVKEFGDNIYLPNEGTTRGLVDELSDLKEDWQIEIASLNKEIDDSEFDVSSYQR